VLDFSAVAYFFAKISTEKYHVPIVLINASVAHSYEAWTSEEGLKNSLRANDHSKNKTRLISMLKQNSIWG